MPRLQNIFGDWYGVTFTTLYPYID